jgi:four helix bundle protein
MSRDYRKLRVFHQADSLVMDIYKRTKHFPREEIYGLQSQLRRGAVSSAANIVEGSARRGEGEYLNFLNIAAGSATEVRYLIDLCRRLGFIEQRDASDLETRYDQLIAVDPFDCLSDARREP